ncbi:hypothetical protein WMY93_009875 [Mugilogobius chulae]|uniref:Ig-like domain-containing protein n=1 Tax=Mugilogobius chulae TaxID=88201 RepID=A0AAW0P942_9GOBI
MRLEFSSKYESGVTFSCSGPFCSSSPELTVPRGRSVLVVQEGESVDLQCLVSGKPKPTVLWFKLGPRRSRRPAAPQGPDAQGETPEGTKTEPEGETQTGTEGGTQGGGLWRVDSGGKSKPSQGNRNRLLAERLEDLEEAVESLGGSAAAGGSSPDSYLVPELADAPLWESADGLLHLANVSREMSGVYRCQTSQMNGFNVRPRQALILLHVHYPPVVEPVFLEVRQALGRAFSLSCGLLGAHPSRGLRFEWKLGSRLLTRGELTQGQTQYQVRALNREGYGTYTCEISNEAGAGRCSFRVTGKAFAPEFYYDSDSSLWQNRPSVYGFRLLWTQREPDSVDRVLAYRLGLRQLSQTRWWEQEIPVDAQIQKGALLSHNLTELVKPESYLVRLTPITRFGEGDASQRIIAYTAPVNPHLRQFVAGFGNSALCLCSQDRSEQFDWTRHNAASRDSKYTPNTGPSADHHGDKSGHYLYIETSRPRARRQGPPPHAHVQLRPRQQPQGKPRPQEQPWPRLLLLFYYHMYGKHIGKNYKNTFIKLQTTASPSTTTCTATHR